MDWLTAAFAPDDEDASESSGDPDVEAPNSEPSDVPSSCSYCGAQDFSPAEDTGRGLRTVCNACGGAMLRTEDGQWAPAGPNATDNHPRPGADPDTGGVGGAANIADADRYNDAAASHIGGKEGEIPADARFSFHIPGSSHVPHELEVHSGNVKIGDLSWRGHQDGDIVGVNTHHQYRRRGIATALYTKAHELAMEHGIQPPGGSVFQTSNGYAFRSSFDELGQRPDISHIPTDVHQPKGTGQTDLRQHILDDHGMRASEDMVRMMSPKKVEEWHENLRKFDPCGFDRQSSIDKFAANMKRLVDGRGLSETESRAIGNYRRTSHSYMNAMLRGEQPEHSGVRTDSMKIDSAIDKHRTTQDLKLYRGVRRSTLDKVNIGDVVHNAGFSSVTTNPDTASNYGDGKYLSFHYPAGSPAIAGNNVDDELILPRELSLQIHHIEGGEHHAHVINGSTSRTAAIDGPDWCGWRHSERCTFPGTKSSGGSAVAVPVDRGPCPWTTIVAQQACPMSKPGPMAVQFRTGIALPAPPVGARERFGYDAETGEQMKHRQSTLIPVKRGGYSGYVHSSDVDEANELDGDEEDHDKFDDDLYEESSPEPTSHERQHYEEHGEMPDSYYNRHDEAYSQAKDRKDAELAPTHDDPELHQFIGDHAAHTDFWLEHAPVHQVSLRQPVFATQPHLVEGHLNRYLGNRFGETHDTSSQPKGTTRTRYLGNETPLMVKHQGRVHAIEGHHRVAAELLRGKPSIRAHYFDADEHGFPEPDEDFKGYYFKGEHHPYTGSLLALAPADIARVASKDTEFGFRLTASWRDVQSKAARIRREGGVHIVVASSDGVGGTVRGDHDTYETLLAYVPGSTKVAYWRCECPWATYAWGRSAAYRKLEGRSCSHALALQYEAAARGMFGKQVAPDTQRPDWWKHTLPLASAMLSRDEDPADIIVELMTGGITRQAARDVLLAARTGNWTDEEQRCPYCDGYLGPMAFKKGKCPHCGHVLAHKEGSVPGWEGAQGPFKHEYTEPHVYARDPHSGAGNCVCGLSLGAPLHVQAAPGVEVPERSRLRVNAKHHFSVWDEEEDDSGDGWHDSEYLCKHCGFSRRHPDHGERHEEWLYGQPWYTDWGEQHDIYGGKDNELHRGIATSLPKEVHSLVHDESQPVHERAHALAQHIIHDGGGHAGRSWSSEQGVSRDYATGTAVHGRDEHHPQGLRTAVVLHVHAPDMAHIETDPDTLSHYTIHGHDDPSNREVPLQHGTPLQLKGISWTNPSRDTFRSPKPDHWGDWNGKEGSDDHLWTRHNFDEPLKVTSAKPQPPSVAGVALVAGDTGRVLMLQRGLEDNKDPARGTWEFPGGHIEEGDPTSLHGSIREWEEEVGQSFPMGGTVTHAWRSGPYQGHVVVVPGEESVDFSNGRSTVNPDDPKGDHHEQSAWWNVDHARKNPALRPECKGTPWHKLKSAPGDAGLTVAALLYGAVEHEDPEFLRQGAVWDALNEIDPYRSKNPPPHSDSENPASTGFLTTQDPSGWDLSQQLPRDLSPNSSVDASLHDELEPALPWTDSESTEWDDEPEGEQTYHERQTNSDIPETDDEVSSMGAMASMQEIVERFQSTAAAQALISGGQKEGDVGFSNEEIATKAREHLKGLSKEAMAQFTFAEQQDLLSEGRGQRARNFNSLALEGTHYHALESALNAMDSEDETIIWI